MEIWVALVGSRFLSQAGLERPQGALVYFLVTWGLFWPAEKIQSANSLQIAQNPSSPTHELKHKIRSNHLHKQSSLGWCPGLCQSGAWKKRRTWRFSLSQWKNQKFRNIFELQPKSWKKNLRLVLVIQPDKRWGNQQHWHHCSSGKDLNVCNKSCAEASQRRWHSNQSMAKKGELSIYCIFVLCPSTALLYNSFLFTDASLDFYARQSGCDLCIPVQGLMRILPCLLQKPLQCFCPHLSQLLYNCALLSLLYWRLLLVWQSGDGQL